MRLAPPWISVRGWRQPACGQSGGLAGEIFFLAPLESTSEEVRRHARYTGGSNWLWFPKEAFQSAIQHTPEKHWYLKRLNPPRLGPDADGFYYCFSSAAARFGVAHLSMCILWRTT